MNSAETHFVRDGISRVARWNGVSWPPFDIDGAIFTRNASLSMSHYTGEGVPALWRRHNARCTKTKVLPPVTMSKIHLWHVLVCAQHIGWQVNDKSWIFHIFAAYNLFKYYIFVCSAPDEKATHRHVIIHCITGWWCHLGVIHVHYDILWGVNWVYVIISANKSLCYFKTRWHCANLFQPIKGFHFLRLYRIKWVICEYRCLYISINVKARFPPTPDLNTPCDDFSRIPVDSYIIVVF